MTAPQPATPGSDGEVCCPQGCVVGGCHTWQAPAAPSEPPAADSPAPGTETCAPDCAERTACPVVGEPGHWQCGTCPEHKEPRHHCGCPAAPSPVDTTERPVQVLPMNGAAGGAWTADNLDAPPAETQQDDERPDSLTVWRRGYQAGVKDARERIRLGHDEPVALAARPSADTETLADRFMSSALDNIGAFDGSNNEARDRAYVRAELVALLDGPR